MDEIKVFPVWIFDFLFYHVLPYAVEYVSGVCPGKGFEQSGYFAVDVQTPMALGLSWHSIFRWHSTVCIWLLQRDAHFHSARVSYNGLI